MLELLSQLKMFINVFLSSLPVYYKVSTSNSHVLSLSAKFWYQIDKSVPPVCRGFNFRVDMETVEMVPNVIDEKYRVAKFDVKK